ncbi:MAG TPA: hypothetical protein VGR22_01670 [Thermomicrobiales bacterium]|nr:hypothetical protein [Thermomicrobiales bacterium]
MAKRILVPGVVVAMFTLLASLVTMAGSVTAQATPPGVATPAVPFEAEIELHPAHIHAGTCQDLGDIVYPLNDLQEAAAVREPDATPPLDLAATPDAEEVVGLVGLTAQSSTEVDATLEELLAEDFAINVHESEENIMNYLACGNITGTPDEGELFIDLHEIDNSGFAGQAELADQGDGTTFVHVTIFPKELPGGTPVDATPTS